MTDAEIGETIAGYVLEEQLGEGSTSRVFVGRHRTAGRRAAIKVLTFSVLESRDARERLLREARSVNDIEHPNIANVYGLHESERPPRVALIMEWVKGPSLRTLRGSPLGPPAARRFALELVSAVRAAHAAHVIHRDLKPDNILFTEHPHSETASLKVVDFGLAKRLGPGDLLHTAAGTMLGTPAYMAPEQIAGRPPPTPATDVYAVAELVYELFVGERAFSADSSQAVLKRKMKGEVPELPMPAPLDKDLRPVLRECLLHEPSRRLGLSAIESALVGLGARALAIPAGQTVLDAHPLGDAQATENTLLTTRPRDRIGTPPARVRDQELTVDTGALDPDAVADAQAFVALPEVDEGAITDIDSRPEGLKMETEAQRFKALEPSLSVVIPQKGPPEPDAESILMPLDLEVAETAPPRHQAAFPLDVPADGEADTEPPRSLEPSAVPVHLWATLAMGLVLLAVLGAMLALR